MIHTLSLLAALNGASALPMPEDTITLNITMNRSTCRTAGAREFNLCSAESPVTRRLTLTLQPVPHDEMEEQAFEATTPSFLMSLPNGGDRYAPWVQIRKSVGMGGTSVIYTLQFRVQNAGAQVGASKIYQTVYMMGDQLRMSEPVPLPADRTEDERGFRQDSFTIMPATQFASVVPDPE